jgi:tetratricopeptide (TPR) repeat protein/CHAT domain-containing protein
MANEYRPLVLEVLKQADTLSMSIFEQAELASTLKHYSHLSFASSAINRLCQELIFILNKSDKNGILDFEAFNNLKKTGQLLWDHLLTGAVKEKLKKVQSQDLTLSLDEELINVPWELLFDGNDFLCLKFNLGRVVRTKTQAPAAPQYRSLPSIPKMLILANPTDDLKSAYAEGVFIKNQLDRKRKEVIIDFKSTNIDTLYIKKNLRDYDIVHFAGHCEYDDEDSDNSGWVLSDGRFAPKDIYALAQTLSLPALIFSNACHSAKLSHLRIEPDCQEKAYSLASAFLFSGVRHYIGAIRKIEDAASFIFAQEFYTQLVSGSKIGDGMRKARAKLIKEYGVSAISWANYLLYGDPNFALFGSKAKLAKPASKARFSLKKPLIAISLAAAILAAVIYLYMWLPSVNPTSYFLLSKSKKLFLQGNNQEVILTCNELIRKDHLFLAVYPLIADTYYRLGDGSKALKYYFEYVRLCQKRNDQFRLAAAYREIGWLYLLQGDYPKAHDFINQGLNLSRKNKDRLNEARAMERLAVWYMDKQDNDKALELLMKSCEINRSRLYKYEHRYGLACDYFDIALVFTNKNDFDAAKEFYAKSKQIFERLKLKYELSEYYFNLGEINMYEKQYQQALDYYQRGLAIDKQQGNKPSLTSDYGMLGELYMAMDNLDEAEDYFNESASLASQINARLELASAYYNLGLLYKKKHRKNKAREYFRQAQEIYRLLDSPESETIKQEFLELDNE